MLSKPLVQTLSGRDINLEMSRNYQLVEASYFLSFLKRKNTERHLTAREIILCVNFYLEIYLNELFQKILQKIQEDFIQRVKF